MNIAVYHPRTRTYGRAIDQVGRQVLVVWDGAQTAVIIDPADLIDLDDRRPLSTRRHGNHPAQHDIYVCLCYLAEVEHRPPTLDELHDELQQRGFPAIGYHTLHSAMKRLIHHGWAHRERDGSDRWRHHPIRRPA